MTANIIMDGKLISNDDVSGRTIPGKTAFWAFRESQIVWGGIIWTRQYQSTGKTMALTGQTFESYAARRYVRSWLGNDSHTYNEGQCHIINHLWNQMQSVPLGNIGVQTGIQFPPNDTVRQLDVHGWDTSQTVDDIINGITSFTDGPDYLITWAEDGNGKPTKQLLLGAPLGADISSTGLSTDYPGNISDYTYTESASQGANQWWASGAGSKKHTLYGKATDGNRNNTLGSGWPLLEGAGNFSGVKHQPIIDARAAQELKQHPMPEVTHTADIAAQIWPQFGTYDLGDYMFFNVLDERFPDPGQIFKLRVIGWSIQPPDTGNGVETVSLVFDEPDAVGVNS